MLSAKASEAEPLKPGKVWDEHSILLLEGREPLPAKLVADIEEGTREVRRSGGTICTAAFSSRSSSVLQCDAAAARRRAAAAGVVSDATDHWLGNSALRCHSAASWHLLGCLGQTFRTASAAL